jgi:hypothetical protein
MRIMKKKRLQKKEQRILVRKSGGLIVVCGPPFSGKSLIGARLAECIPNSVKLEAEDNLLRAGEVWYPDDRRRDPVRNPQKKMLEAAGEIWDRCPDKRAPFVIIIARFATPAARQRAYKLALSHNVSFFLIQASSTNLRSMRTMSQLLLPPRKAEKRVAQITKDQKKYRPLTKDEKRRFACLSLKGDLGILDNLFLDIVKTWLA